MICFGINCSESRLFVGRYILNGNGNLIEQIDKDGLVTQYAYSPLDLVNNINYNGGKQVSYAYNKVGELVQMEDWLGTATYEVDLLRQLTKVTDHKNRVVEYTLSLIHILCSGISCRAA